MSINVVVEDCTDKNIIWNLYPLYLHDLSCFTGETVNYAGSYDFEEIEVYWDNDIMYPLLVRVDEEIAGFIMVTEKPYSKEGTDYCIQEFFILNKFKRKGVGNLAFGELLKTFNGVFSLKIVKDNIPAYRFWINNYTTNNIDYVESIVDDKNYAHVFHA